MPDSPTASKSQCFGRGWQARSSTPEGIFEVREESFFDPRDIVQVKVRLLRVARVRRQNVGDPGVSDEYGVTRPTLSAEKADFEGHAGLVPRKRGPRGPHQDPERGLGLSQGSGEQN